MDKIRQSFEIAEREKERQRRSLVGGMTVPDTIPDKDLQMSRLNEDNLSLNEDNEGLQLEIIKLKGLNRTLSSKLITQQETYQGQAHFLDALENLLLDHGYKMVDANA